MHIKNVSVIGSGIMGRQIAMQAAIHGYEVVCYDISPDNLKEAKGFSDEWFLKRIEKGKLDPDKAAGIQRRLAFTTDINKAAQGADILIEAVSDVLTVKRTVLTEFDKLTPEHCIYASNSSYIVSSKFCDAVKDPSKVINVHFFNPALVMKVVEIVKGPHVSQETFDVTFDFIKSIDKTPIKIEKEIYGFVVNRVFSALTREACYLLDSGVASVEDIDKAIKGALGHRMGPLETLDMTGIDLEYTVYMEKFKASGDKSDLPAACLTERYARGEFGSKSGKGFYDYPRVGSTK